MLVAAEQGLIVVGVNHTCTTLEVLNVRGGEGVGRMSVVIRQGMRMGLFGLDSSCELDYLVDSHVI